MIPETLLQRALGALRIAGATGAALIASLPLAAQECPREPLVPPQFYGFGDFQGEVRQPAPDGTLDLDAGRIDTWSGWVVEWRDPPLPLGNHDRMIVEVSNLESGRYSVPKLMKWYIQWPGQENDTALIVEDAQQRSSDDPEWVRPSSTIYEFPLPLDALSAGALSKIGLLVHPGNAYHQVSVVAFLGCLRG